MGAGGRMSMVVFMVFAVVAAIQLPGSKAQTTHAVGGTMGWMVPSGGSNAYSTWASAQNFTVGDVLLFNFVNQSHNVAEVSRTAYDSCNTTTTISLVATSPARITLATAGEHFYTCTFPRHCSLGQQLAINVTGATSAIPPSVPSPNGQTAPPPPSSSALPFAVAANTVLATFLAIAVGFLY